MPKTSVRWNTLKSCLRSPASGVEVALHKKRKPQLSPQGTAMLRVPQSNEALCEDQSVHAYRGCEVFPRRRGNVLLVDSVRSFLSVELASPPSSPPHQA